jgi:cell pole-organizing protein PopZ
MVARPEVEPATPTGSQTMDAFVADLLRPMLGEWLDAHLPEIVEAMVAKEIARITGNR